MATGSAPLLVFRYRPENVGILFGSKDDLRLFKHGDLIVGVACTRRVVLDRTAVDVPRRAAGVTVGNKSRIGAGDVVADDTAVEIADRMLGKTDGTALQGFVVLDDAAR